MKATKKLNFAQTAAVVEQPTSHDIESLRQTFEFKLSVLKNEMDHNLTGLSRRAPTNSSIDQSVDKSTESKLRNIPNAPPIPEPIPAQITNSHSEIRNNVCHALIHRHNMTIEANFN
tara:strand:- start:523 stop:873 length:351 start_codon:yes stop_codon:yes gene_type:complete